MSNLSDLLPAGAAAKQLTFTDSGSGISSKAPVVLNSDGTVSAISGGPTQEIGTADTILATNAGFSPAAAYDSNSNKIVLAYRDTTPHYGKAVVGTPSGTSISWGTPVTFQSSSTTQIGICFDSTENKIVIAYSDLGDSQYGKAIVGDVSGSTISFGSAVTFYSGTTSSSSCVYDTSNSKVVVAYYRSSGYADVGTVSGTSISFGTAVQYTANNITSINTVFDSSANKVIITYSDNTSSGAGTSVVGTVSGTTMSFGSAAVWNSGDSGYQNSAYDASADRTLICYRDDGDSQIGKGIVAQVSGTSLTYGSETNIGTTNTFPFGMAYDPDGAQVLVAYGSGNDSFKGRFRKATVSGLTVSFSEEFTYLDGTDGGYLTCVYNTTDDKGVIIFKNDSSSGYTQSVAITLGYTNLTAQAFVGVADSAISASAAGSVIVQGGTVGGVNLGTGVSLGATSTVEAVDPLDLRTNGLNIYDSTNNKHIIVYLDAGASNEGSGAVGTISGTTVSYGTPVVFQSQNLEYIGGAYDSTNEKVLVCYRGYDTGQNFYLHGVVGTVSGTSISWGTPTALNSVSSYLTTQGVQFDSNTGKFLVCYQDGSANSAAAALVATVSGTSVSAGTPVTFDAPGSPGTFHHCASYDANAQKFLVTWTRQTNYYIYAAVATISGTSVSFGTTLNWYSTSSYYQRVNYDSNAQKHLSVYNLSNGNGLGAAVATISGTDVTYGSATNFVADTIASSYPEQTYDSTAQQMLIFANVGNSSPEPMIAYTGTISGTSVTVSSGTTILSGNNYFIGQSTYNPSANKTLVLWELSATSLDSAVGTLGDLPLTVGTKYYVTTSGTFSSSADTPSVNAGLAISTTSLLLNGDS